MKKIVFLSLFISLFMFGNAQTQLVYEHDFLVKIGDTAPDFTIRYTDGRTAALSDFRGKVVMLQFTASWCGVCRQEMPHIEAKIWNRFKDKNFALFGVDRAEPVEKVKWLAEKMNVSYPLILDENSEIFGLYALKTSGVTRNVVIDEKGKVVFLTRLFKEHEFNKMIEKIDELLKN